MSMDQSGVFACPGRSRLSSELSNSSCNVRMSKRVRYSKILRKWLTVLPGTKVAPSDRFPSVFDKPTGFLHAGMWTFLMAVCRMSLIRECLTCLGILILHDGPCSPLASTCELH